MESIQQERNHMSLMPQGIATITMGAPRVHDPTQGSGVFLVEVKRLIDKRDPVDRRLTVSAVEVFVLGEDGSERTLVLPYECGSIRGVPMSVLADRLGCSPDRIEL